MKITYQGRTVDMDDRFNAGRQPEHGTLGGYRAGCRDTCCRSIAARANAPSRQGGGSMSDLAALIYDPHALDWHDQAACHPDQRPPDLTPAEWTAIWFPARGESHGPARAYCLTCPVRDDCLAQALDQNQKHGVWGGSSERARRQMRRRSTAA